MTEQAHIVHQDGDVIDVTQNRLKKSPRHARRKPHAAATVEAIAASMAAKRMYEPLVVEPETDEAGAATGGYLVTIGEGRRLALLLRAKRKQIKKTQAVRCILDLTSDPLEISLDANVTGESVHPADQYETFRELAERHGWGAEELGARFGVTPQIVRSGSGWAPSAPGFWSATGPKT